MYLFPDQGSIPNTKSGTGGFPRPCLKTLYTSPSKYATPDDISVCIFFVGNTSICTCFHANFSI